MSRPISKLMIMAGGTGGHVYPALAVANELRNHNARVAWLGTRKGLEASIVPVNNFEMHWVNVGGLRGTGLITWLLAPFNLLRAMWQSAIAIRAIQPDCVLGMGGFVAGPGGLMTKLLGRPLIVHEQNAVAGLTNRLLAKVANRTLTGFPDVAGLPDNSQWVGNPVRADIQPSAPKESTVINVLVIGGSQGAHSLNLHLPRLFKQQNAAINIWHQSGRGRAAEVQKRYRSLALNARVSNFIDDMAAAYQWADILVCRAGAMTIAECCAAAKPALMIPFPHSAGDHQTINAQALVDVGGAVMMSNQALCESIALPELSGLLANRERLIEMGQKAHKLHKADALQKVVSACEEYLNA